MAVVRPKTSSTSYGSIIFLAFLLVIAIAVAVIFYKKNEELDKTAKTAQANLRSLGSDTDVNEFKSPTRFGDKLQEKKLLRNAMDQVDLLRSKIAGAAAGTAVPATVLTDPDGLIDSKLAGVGYKDQTLFSAIDGLATQRSQNESRAKAAEANLAAAQTAATNERQRYETERDAWRKTLQTLQQEKDQLVAQVQGEEKAHKDDVAKYESQIDAAQKSLGDAQRENAVKLKQKDDEVARRQNEVDRLKIQIAGLKPKNPADLSNEPDGRVIRTDSNSDIVFVNVGTADHAMRGLTFAVYEPGQAINVGNDAAGHEKASLELIEIAEHESMARVTHTEKGQYVKINDIIANPVFHSDRNRKFHFFVAGDFDLDGDGIPTPAERDQLIRLIQNWGGVIDDQLTTQTDFLVLGAPPSSSTHVFDTGTDEDKARLQNRAAEQKTYNDLIARAHDFSIPVLNSNRFLAMIGYYNTTTVHPPLFRTPK